MRDSVLSFHHPATPYGFGLALYLISVSAGVSFPTLDRGSETDPDTFAALIKDPLRPAPTFIFGAADVVAKPVYSLILSEMLGDSSFIIRAARDGKLRLLREGIVTKQSFWDAIVCAFCSPSLTEALFADSAPTATCTPLQTRASGRTRT